MVSIQNQCEVGTQRGLEISKRISKALSISVLEEIMQQHLHEFNVFNVAAALDKLAKLRASLPMHLVQKLRQTIVDLKDYFTMQALSTSFLAIAIMKVNGSDVNVYDTELLQMLCAVAESKRALFGTCKPYQIANMASALVCLGMCHTPLFAMLRHDGMTCSSEFSATDMSVTLWAFVRSKTHTLAPSPWDNARSIHRWKLFTEKQVQGSVSMVNRKEQTAGIGAKCKTIVQQLQDACTGMEVLAIVEREASSFDAMATKVALQGIAAFGVRPSQETMEFLHQCIVDNISHIDGEAAANIVWSLATIRVNNLMLNIKQEQIVHMLLCEAAKMKPNMQANDCANMRWAAIILNIGDSELTSVLEQRRRTLSASSLGSERTSLRKLKTDVIAKDAWYGFSGSEADSTDDDCGSTASTNSSGSLYSWEVDCMKFRPPPGLEDFGVPHLKPVTISL